MLCYRQWEVRRLGFGWLSKGQLLDFAPAVSLYDLDELS